MYLLHDNWEYQVNCCSSVGSKDSPFPFFEIRDSLGNVEFAPIFPIEKYRLNVDAHEWTRNSGSRRVVATPRILWMNRVRANWPISGGALPTVAKSCWNTRAFLNYSAKPCDTPTAVIITEPWRACSPPRLHEGLGQGATVTTCLTLPAEISR